MTQRPGLFDYNAQIPPQSTATVGSLVTDRHGTVGSLLTDGVNPRLFRCGSAVVPEQPEINRVVLGVVPVYTP